MLQIGAVEPATLGILKQLMSVPELANFSLAGGTALALHYGHRKSVDLDLFSSSEFDTDIVITALEKAFPTIYKHISTNSIGIFGYIDNVKIDLVKYHFYSIIAPIVKEEGIRLLSSEDIMAMKVNAILRRGVKKDFWDIAELLEHFSVEEMIDNYIRKYTHQILPVSIPRALIYFDDADASDDPICLKGQTWSGIKRKIRDKVDDFLK